MPNTASPEAWLKAAAETAGIQVYPIESPEKKEPPFAVFSREATDRDYDTGTGATGAVAGTFLLMIFSDGYLAAKTLADAIRTALNNFSGVASGATIDRVQITEERDGPAVQLDGRSAVTYVIEQTYSIEWNE